MLSVAVETSTATGSIALFSDSRLLGEKSWSRDGSHSEFLTESFQSLLAENQCSVREIQRIAVGLGPGSFTGVRVAVNFARALGFANSIQIFGLNSLALLAHQKAVQNQSGLISVCQFGFRDICYVATFQRQLDQGRATLVEIEAPSAKTAHDLQLSWSEPRIVIGDGLTRLSSRFSKDFLEKMRSLPESSYTPLAKDFASTEWLRSSPNLNDWIHTIPLYVRASEAEEKLKSGQLKPV